MQRRLTEPHLAFLCLKLLKYIFESLFPFRPTFAIPSARNSVQLLPCAGFATNAST